VYGYCDTVADMSPLCTAANASSMPSTPMIAIWPFLPAFFMAWAMPSAIWSLAAKKPLMSGFERMRSSAAFSALERSQSPATVLRGSKRPFAPVVNPSTRALLVASPEMPPITPMVPPPLTRPAIVSAASPPAATLSVPM